jgi:hypothetical protein
MIKHKKIPGSDSDARFLGWQKTHSGEVFAFYNITAADHPLYGSTVTDDTLNKLNLQIPELPSNNVKGDSLDIQKRATS